MANARYCSSEITGTATTTINGRSFTTGPDTAFQASTNPATDDGGANSGIDIATPCLTLAQAILFITEDTDIYCTGRFRVPDATTYAALVDAANTTGVKVRFLQWPGKPEAHVIGANFPGGTKANNLTKSATYWQAATNGWKILCDGSNGKPDLRSATLSDVTFDWDDPLNIDSTGRRKSHMKLGANVAAITSGTRGAQGLYFLDTVTNPGTLYVLMPTFKGDGTTAQTNDPTSVNANGFEYSVAGRAGIVFNSTGGAINNDSCAVSGLRFSRWGGVSDTSPSGSSLAFLYGQNCSVTNCIFEDSQRHAIGLGGAVVNQNVSSCGILGAVAGSVIVVYNASGGSNSASGTFSDSTIEAYSFLGHDGLKVGAATGIIGFYAHGTHHSVVMRNVTTNVYDPASGTPASYLPVDSDNATAPANLDLHSSFPIRVENCAFNGCTEWYNEGVTTYISFLNCSVFGTQADQVYQVGLFARSSAVGRWRFEGCH